jgi:outer membrane protein assembly factor BamB
MFHHDLAHTGYSKSTAPLTDGVLWTYKTGSGVVGSPAVVDGVVYIGASGEGHALNATTGAIKWKYTTRVFVHSSPAVANGILYVGSGARFYALNAETGTSIWNYTAGRYIFISCCFRRRCLCGFRR